MLKNKHSMVVICVVLVCFSFGSLSLYAAVPGVFSVRDYGATGDGKTLDTDAINQAIDDCAKAGGGQVLITPGRYLSGTIHLKSHITLYLSAGATLIGTPDLTCYQQPTVPASMPEARWGKWHRALILAENAQDIHVAGPGEINGNKVFDPTGEEKMRGPHTFVFVGCDKVSIRDVTFRDSANYAVFFMLSDHVDISNVTFIGGWDGVHFRGSPDRDCKDVQILNCRFYTGDDSIAGRYWDRTLIANCIINSSCNGLRLIGPAKHLMVHDCLFYGPGVEPHRSQDRYNMLAGINLQPGAWDATKGLLDDVRISDITMHNVTTPFHFSLKPGNTAGRIEVDRVTATGVYRSAASVESWADTAFQDIIFRDVTITYEGGGKVADNVDIHSPGVDARSLPVWGFYARNVKKLSFDNVRFRVNTPDQRPVFLFQNIEQVNLDGVTFPTNPNVSEIMLLDNVKNVQTNQYHSHKDDKPEK